MEIVAGNLFLVPVAVWVFSRLQQLFKSLSFLIHKIWVVLDGLLGFNMCSFTVLTHISTCVFQFYKNTYKYTCYPEILPFKIGNCHIIITCYCIINIILILFFIKLNIVCLIVLLLSEKSKVTHKKKTKAKCNSKNTFTWYLTCFMGMVETVQRSFGYLIKCWHPSITL